MLPPFKIDLTNQLLSKSIANCLAMISVFYNKTQFLSILPKSIWLIWTRNLINQLFNLHSITFTFNLDTLLQLLSQPLVNVNPTFWANYNHSSLNLNGNHIFQFRIKGLSAKFVVNMDILLLFASIVQILTIHPNFLLNLSILFSSQIPNSLILQNFLTLQRLILLLSLTLFLIQIGIWTQVLHITLLRTSTCLTLWHHLVVHIRWQLGTVSNSVSYILILQNYHPRILLLFYIRYITLQKFQIILLVLENCVLTIKFLLNLMPLIFLSMIKFWKGFSFKVNLIMAYTNFIHHAILLLFPFLLEFS